MAREASYERDYVTLTRVRPYKELYQDILRIYQAIGSVACPGLGGEQVRFNRQGWAHILRKRRRRPRREQYARLSLIPLAARILANPAPCIEYREMTSRTGQAVRYWAFAESVDARRIKVVVRQVGNGDKHFYSIFAANKKSPSRKETL